jgi:hypothetical protein
LPCSPELQIRQQIYPNRQKLPTRLHGIMIQTTTCTIRISTFEKTSRLLNRKNGMFVLQSPTLTSDSAYMISNALSPCQFTYIIGHVSMCRYSVYIICCDSAGIIGYVLMPWDSAYITGNVLIVLGLCICNWSCIKLLQLRVHRWPSVNVLQLCIHHWSCINIFDSSCIVGHVLISLTLHTSLVVYYNKFRTEQTEIRVCRS